ncbi:M23 family metallopeptidase [Luteimonas sp. MJ246]|uniref:M23 family metallopeptidase n=1 Tax=Luteimonas sp. MJ174 TaxID=3129237 RepID=UPI0031BB3504
MAPAERARILRIAPASQVPSTGGASNVASAGAGDARPGEAGMADAPDTGTHTRSRAASPAEPGGMPAAPGTAARAQHDPAPSEGLLLPVQGVEPSALSPTYDDARGEGRVHEALDIMAPTGTPVLAVADGHVEKLFDSRQGGLTIYQFDPDARFAYYYAHLDSYAPGLAEQQQVSRGQVIGHVGSSGNADPAAPHLHFAIFVLGPEKQWWKGRPIDPYPLFATPR